MTGTVTVLPLEMFRKVTIVPHGNERWATPTRSLVSLWPQAVPLPYSPGPYHEISPSKRQKFLGTDFALGFFRVGRTGA